MTILAVPGIRLWDSSKPGASGLKEGVGAILENVVWLSLSSPSEVSGVRSFKDLCVRSSVLANRSDDCETVPIALVRDVMFCVGSSARRNPDVLEGSFNFVSTPFQWQSDLSIFHSAALVRNSRA